MKRVLAGLLILVLLASGCAYAAVTGQEEAAYLLYLREADLANAPGGDALRAETVYLDEEEQQGVAQVAQALMEELLAGPVDETLVNTIPAGTTLLSLELDGARALVDLSSAYSTLSGVELTLADYAIALTLTQLPEIASVSIMVRGKELAYRTTQRFSPRDVLLSSTEDVVGTVEAHLYFRDSRGNLTAEERTLELYEGDTQVAAVLQGLEEGPRDRSLLPVIPEGFRAKSVWLEEDVCYVNLSAALLAELPEETEMAPVVRAMALSLKSLDTVGEVRFLVDGEYAARYADAVIADPY